MRPCFKKFRSSLKTIRKAWHVRCTYGPCGRPRRETVVWGGELKFKGRCCQSTLSRCRPALADWQRVGLRKHREMTGDIKENKDEIKMGLKWEWQGSVSSKVKKNKNRFPLCVPSPLSFHCYLDERGAVPAPLAGSKWLAGIWCNLHLSVLKAGYCFCGADVGGQLTGPHSWERCVWPTYRGSSSQLRATILIAMMCVALLSSHSCQWSLLFYHCDTLDLIYRRCDKCKTVKLPCQKSFLIRFEEWWELISVRFICVNKSHAAQKRNQKSCRVLKLQSDELSRLRFALMKTKRGTLETPDRFPKPRSVLMPKVDKWRLCWDYNKDAKAIIQSTLTNVVPVCEQMGRGVWVGNQAEYPSPSWLENTGINSKPRLCHESPIILVSLCLTLQYFYCLN